MKDIMVKAKKKEGMFVAATEGGKSGVPAVRVFHEHAKIYDSWYENSLVFAIELAALQSLQTMMKGPGIEIGVGPGRFAREIGLEFGLDPAWKPLVLACRRGIQCCQGVGEQLPLRDRAMGRIYLLFTLCFTRDPQKVLAECCRCLRDDGHLVIGMIPQKKQRVTFFINMQTYTRQRNCSSGLPGQAWSSGRSGQRCTRHLIILKKKRRRAIFWMNGRAL